MIMPLGTYIRPYRLTGLAAVFAIADSAGTMLSSSGSATAAPRPRRTIRREMAFLVMNMIALFALCSLLFALCSTQLSVASRSVRRRHRERRAADDAGNDRRPVIVSRGRVADDFANRGRVGVLHSPTPRIREEL